MKESTRRAINRRKEERNKNKYKVCFEALPRVYGYEYPNFIKSVDVIKIFCLSDGNTVIQDKEGRLFNVHPLLTSRWVTEERKNERIDPSYPVRWQLGRVWDIPQEVKDQVLIDTEQGS